MNAEAFNAIGFDSPMMLWILPLLLVPVFLHGQRLFDYPAIILLPVDRTSRWIERILKLLGIIMTLGLVMGMAGLHLKQSEIERIGHGAHIMMVLDRSASMNDDFAGRYISKPADQSLSKSAVARDVIAQFIESRKQDLVGLITFSTSPVFVVPLTHDQEALMSALASADVKGMGFTAVARGLGMALDYFKGKPVTGARLILLVSDGGAHIDSQTQDQIRTWFAREHAALAWIYIRGVNSPSIFIKPEDGDDSASAPEYFLHEYFKTLNVPYQAYEAENPTALKAAMEDVGRMHNLPSHYFEKQPRRDMAGWGYAIALMALGLLITAKRMEINTWHA
ncbi:MAG: VWA domain-containing protein [Methylophilaceae bacterium]